MLRAPPIDLFGTYLFNVSLPAHLSGIGWLGIPGSISFSVHLGIFLFPILCPTKVCQAHGRLTRTASGLSIYLSSAYRDYAAGDNVVGFADNEFVSPLCLVH